MHEFDTYSEEIPYPLQNGVLSTLGASKAPFYLTGGTALHRHYFGFRYSDDLDLFVNQDAGVDGHVDRALAALRERDYRFDGDAFLRTDQYARVLITANQAALKVDFVNDSAPRLGTMVSGITSRFRASSPICTSGSPQAHCCCSSGTSMTRQRLRQWASTVSTPAGTVLATGTVPPTSCAGYDSYRSAQSRSIARCVTILRTWNACTIGRRAPRLPSGSDRYVFP